VAVGIAHSVAHGEKRRRRTRPIRDGLDLVSDSKRCYRLDLAKFHEGLLPLSAKTLRRAGVRCIPMLPVMQVGRVRPGAPPEHDVLHPVGGGLGQARPTNNIGIHGLFIRG